MKIKCQQKLCKYIKQPIRGKPKQGLVLAFDKALNPWRYSVSDAIDKAGGKRRGKNGKKTRQGKQARG